MESAFGQFTWALTRVVFGLSLAFLHGYGKIFRGQVVGLTRMVADMGIPAAQFFAWCASLSEFVGGILIAIGLATRGAATFAAITMGVALYRQRNGPFAEMELALHYFAVMILAMAIGGGRFSLDSWARLRSPVSRR